MAMLASPVGGLELIEQGHQRANKMADWCKQAGVPGRSHGLRKAAATRAADRGASTLALKAMFGWLDIKHSCYPNSAQFALVAGDLYLIKHRLRVTRDSWIETWFRCNGPHNGFRCYGCGRTSL